MEALDLPPLLAGILDGLAREVSRASIAAAIRRQLQQGAPPWAAAGLYMPNVAKWPQSCVTALLRCSAALLWLVLPTPVTISPPFSRPAAQSPLSLVRQDAYASLAASLDAYLRDPLRAAAVLPALGAVWPELLQSIALGLRQAPTGAGLGVGASPGPSPSPGSAGGGAVSYRSVSHGELTCMVRVLELACLLALQVGRCGARWVGRTEVCSAAWGWGWHLSGLACWRCGRAHMQRRAAAMVLALFAKAGLVHGSTRRRSECTFC